VSAGGAAPSEAATPILCTLANGIAFVTLNRPSALNALSFEMVRQLGEQLREYAQDPAVLALVLRGAGGKAFCAGGDIRALYQNFKASGSLQEPFFVVEYGVDYSLHRYPKPTVVLADGITMGGGMGLAQGSRLRIVGERTRMAMPEAAIGLFPDVGGSYFLSRLPGSLGTYLALTGAQLRAADALYCGLADLYLPAAAIGALEAALGELVWGADAAASLRAALGRLAGAEPAPTPDAAPLAALRAAIDLHFAHDSLALIVESLLSERRPAYAAWAEETLGSIAKASPTMLCVSLAQLRRGRRLSLADCFRMELGMMRQCSIQGDFLEGVRALIIDKDGAPRWRPPRLADVTAADVEVFFEDHWPAAAHPLAHLEQLAPP